MSRLAEDASGGAADSCSRGEERPPAELLTFGETMGLFVATTIGTANLARTFSLSVGGAESNVAIGASRLGTRTTWIGRVGADAAGDLVVETLRSAGVTVHAIRDDSFTGLMVRHRRTVASAQVDYHRGGSAGSRLTPADIPADAIRSASTLHVTGITAAISESARAAVFAAVDEASSAGVPVSLDINYRRNLWSKADAQAVLRELVARSRIVFADMEEARLVTGSDSTEALALARQLQACGPAEAIVKDGARGCSAVIDGNALVEGGKAVPVVFDVVGAGDAFVAGYLAERLAGRGPQARLELATVMGAYATMVPGDCELLPTREELRAFAQQRDVWR